MPADEELPQSNTMISFSTVHATAGAGEGRSATGRQVFAASSYISALRSDL